MAELVLLTPIGGTNKASFYEITGSTISATSGMDLTRIVTSSADKDPRAGAFVMDFDSEQMNEAMDDWLETRLTTVATEQQTSTYENGETASYSPSASVVTNDLMMYAYPLVPGATEQRVLVSRVSVTGASGTISTSANTAGKAPIQVTAVATPAELTIPDGCWTAYGFTAPETDVVLPVGSTGKIVYATPA